MHNGRSENSGAKMSKKSLTSHFDYRPIFTILSGNATVSSRSAIFKYCWAPQRCSRAFLPTLATAMAQRKQYYCKK